MMPKHAERLLEVQDLHVHIPVVGAVVHALRGVSFHLDRCETLCIVGESGCGKSITALALMGLLPSGVTRNASRLTFNEHDLMGIESDALRKIRGKKISMIFQEPMTSLNPSFTIGFQLMDVVRCHDNVSMEEARKRAVELLEKVGISDPDTRLTQYPHQLSGGLRQRVMIAMALICRPELLIADEPTTALDVTVQAELLRLLKDLQQEMSMGLIFITHDLGLVSRIADRVVVMYAGQVVETTPVAALFDRPLHPYTQGLLSCLLVPGRLRRGARLPTISGVVPTLAGALQGCAFQQRCALAQDACARDMISLTVVDEHSAYRCVHSLRSLTEQQLLNASGQEA
jgi:peptide/nickel transport system ATP-binding protein